MAEKPVEDARVKREQVQREQPKSLAEEKARREGKTKDPEGQQGSTLHGGRKPE